MGPAMLLKRRQQSLVWQTQGIRLQTGYLVTEVGPSLARLLSFLFIPQDKRDRYGDDVEVGHNFPAPARSPFKQARPPQSQITDNGSLLRNPKLLESVY